MPQPRSFTRCHLSAGDTQEQDRKPEHFHTGTDETFAPLQMDFVRGHTMQCKAANVCQKHALPNLLQE